MRMEAMEVQFHVFSTAAVDGGEWLAYSTGRLTSGERASFICCTGGSVGSRTSRTFWRTENFLVVRELKYDS
jgi:hypothetical protein